MVLLRYIKFLQRNLRFTIRMLFILTNLIERYLIKALEYESANHEQLYLPGTDILRPEALEERINILSSSKEYASYAYVCGKVYMSEAMEQKEAESRLCTLIRGSDCLGIDRDGHYIVILMNMTANNLNIVRDRFEKNGFLLEVEV